MSLFDRFPTVFNGTSSPRPQFQEQQLETLRRDADDEELRMMLATDQPRGNDLFIKAADHYLRGNPSRFLQHIQSVQSDSAAHNFVFLATPGLYNLEDEMYRKDQAISSSINMVVASVLRRNQEFLSSDDDDDFANEVRDQTKAGLTRSESMFNWDDQAHTALLGMLLHGFSGQEMIWDDFEGTLYPSAYIHRHPGQFVFDEFGNPYLWIDSPMGSFTTPTPTRVDPQPLPNWKFIFTRQPSLYGNPYGKSAIFNLQWIYEFKRLVLKAWFFFISNYGTPLLKGTISQDVAQNDATRLINELKAIIESINEKSGVVVPPGADIDSLQRMAGQSKTPHLDFLNWANSLIVTEILGATLQVMESKFGTRAQSQTHEGTAETKNKPIAKLLERSRQIFVVNPYVEINFGPGVTPPIFRIDTDDQVDVEQALEIIKLSTELGVPVSRTQFRDWTGLNVPIDDDDTMPLPGIMTINELRAQMNMDPLTLEDTQMLLQRSGGSNVTQVDATQTSSVDGGDDFAEYETVNGKRRKKKSFQEDAIEIARDDSEKIEAIAQSLRDINRDRLRTAVIDARNAADPEKAFKTFESPGVGEDLEEALLASTVIGAWSFAKTVREEAPEVFEANFVEISDDDLDGLPPDFDDAVKWMGERDIITVDEAIDIAETISRIEPERTFKTIAREVRREAFAISEAADLEVTERIRNTLTRSVERGETLADFLGNMDKIIDEGGLPGGSDAYLENVYRTETSNAKHQQGLEHLQDENIDDNLWGLQLFNPDDDRSRQSHADINLLLLRKGSEAYEKFLADGRPPFSFQCRCTMIPVIVVDIETAEEEEPSNALSLVNKIERFNDETK